MTDDIVSLPIKRIDPEVELPSYAYAGDAGLDLRASEDVTLAPLERRLVSTGLAVAIPDTARNTRPATTTPDIAASRPWVAPTARMGLMKANELPR